MASSALLVVLSLLAAATTAAAAYCSSSSHGIIAGKTITHPVRIIQSSTNIDFYNYCPYSNTLQGLFVMACSDVWPPTVQVQSLTTARILTNTPPGYANIKVQGYAFCAERRLAADSKNNNMPLIGGALPVDGLMRANEMLPLNAGMPMVGALPGAEAMPVYEAVPAGPYGGNVDQQYNGGNGALLPWN